MRIELTRIDHEFHYYFHDAWSEAATNAYERATKLNVNTACEYDTIIAIGFSWGARAAIKFADTLKSNGVRVDLVFLVDPAERVPVLEAATGLFKMPANVSRSLNIYQTVGGSVVGHRVDGVTVQTHFPRPKPNPVGQFGAMKIVDDGTTDYNRDGVRSRLDADLVEVWNAHVADTTSGAHVAVGRLDSTYSALKAAVGNVPEWRVSWQWPEPLVGPPAP